MPHIVTHPDGYVISDDPARFDFARAFRWIGTESYWSDGIPEETFRRAVANSLAVGVYAPDGAMVAMARIVTDRATFAWLSDVWVDAPHRGAGLGTRLVAYIRAHPDLQGLRRIHLVTRDAHALYAKFGFAPLDDVERWMGVVDREVYRRSKPRA